MPIRFEQSPDGRRRAITVGLATLNETECAVELVGSMTDDAGQPNCSTISHTM